MDRATAGKQARVYDDESAHDSGSEPHRQVEPAPDEQQFALHRVLWDAAASRNETPKHQCWPLNFQFDGRYIQFTATAAPILFAVVAVRLFYRSDDRLSGRFGRMFAKMAV